MSVQYDLESEENKKVLIRVSQFVLEETAEGIRDDLQEKITEAAMYWGLKNDEFASFDKIKKLIKKEIRLIEFPNIALKNILSRLQEKASITENDKGWYKLSVLRHAEFAKLVNERKRKIDRINGQFLLFLEQEYGRKLAEKQMEEGLEKLYSLLASLTFEKSDLVARILTQKNLENLPMEISLHKLFSILGKIDDIDLRNAELRAIKRLFRESSEDFSRFLFSLTQNLVCIQILNLDPECQALERKAFSNKTIFLDTNILIGLVCPTDFQHTPAMHLVTLSSSLGAKVFITKTTSEEYMSILEAANKVIEMWNAPMKFLETADNEFLVSFWSEKQNNQSLSWNSYYQRNKDVGKVLDEMGIKPFVEDLGRIRRHEQFKTIMTHVNECYLSVKGRGKNEKVCDHDALIMLLVRELRKEQEMTLLGPDYWFITGDESLLCVDNYINSIPYFSDKAPSSMLCDVWLEIISPFLPLSVRDKDAYEAFSVLIKQQFALVPFQIDARKLVRIQGSWTKYEWLDAKDIIKIQNQEWTRRYLRQLEKAKNQGDKTKAEEMGKVFAKKLEGELRKIKDDKLTTLSKEKKKLEEREILLETTIQEKTNEVDKKQALIETQNEDIAQKESMIQVKIKELQKENQFKRELRKITTIAGLFLAFSPIILIITGIFLITIETITYSAVSLFFAVICLYFGIAPEKAKVEVKAKLPIPQLKDD